MAAELTQILISGSKIKLTAGSYQLVWGSVNPQELNNRQVVVLCDSTDDEVYVYLPPTTQQQSNFAQFVVGKISDDLNNIYLKPSDGDNVNGNPDYSTKGNFEYFIAQNFDGNNWSTFQTRGK